MALARFNSTVQDENGNVVPGAMIEVRQDSGSFNLAALYSDRSGTTPLGNPFAADASGQFGFHVVGGPYRIRAYTGNSINPDFEVSWSYVGVGTSAETDIDQLGQYLQAGIAPFMNTTQLFAVTPDPENPQYLGAAVYDDPDPANNGYWLWDDVALDWEFARGFPDTVARLHLTGNGTVQTGTPQTGVNPGSVIQYFATVGTENDGPFSVIIGVTEYDVVNAAGEPLSAGEWTGLVEFFLNDAGDLQLINDPGSRAAAAQSATDAAAEKGYAEEWAQSPDPISVAAGGDGVTDKSSKTWAGVSEGHADRAETAEDAAVAAAASAASANYATRTILKAVVPTAAGQIAYLGEEGREGKFRWRVGNYSAQVTADPLEGLYIAADSDPTGAAGVWERVLKDQRVYPEYWGGTGAAFTGDDGAITAAGTTFSSPSAAFTSDDIGKPIAIRGAGMGGVGVGGVDAGCETHYSTITAVIDANTVTIEDAAITTVSVAQWGYGTDDTDAWKAAIVSGYHINGKKDAIYYTTATVGGLSSGQFVHLHGSKIVAAWEQATPVSDPGAEYEAVFFNENAHVCRLSGGALQYLGTYFEGASNSYQGLVAGIHANECDDFSVKKMEIYGFSRWGVGVGSRVDLGLIPDYAKRPKVIECHLHHNRVAGCAYGRTIDGMVVNNDLSFSGDETDNGTGYGFTGWSAHNPKNTLVRGNQANDNWRKGIDFHDGTDGIVSANFCKRNRSMGIFANGVKGDWVVSGNNIGEMSWDNTFPTGFLACISLGSQVGQGAGGIPTRFVVTANIIRDVNVSAGSGYPFILYGAGLSYGSFTFGGNTVDVARITNIIASSNGVSAGDLGNWYDFTATGNIFKAQECVSVPFYIRSTQNRAKIFSNNTVEVGAASTTSGVLIFDTPTVANDSFIAEGNAVIAPDTLWSLISGYGEPFGLKGTISEFMRSNVINGERWRDWEGGRFIGRGPGANPPADNRHWTVGSVWYNSAPAAGVSPGSFCVAEGKQGSWKAMAALAA